MKHDVECAAVRGYARPAGNVTPCGTQISFSAESSTVLGAEVYS